MYEASSIEKENILFNTTSLTQLRYLWKDVLFWTL